MEKESKLVFKNPGVLDIRFLEIMGVSAKTNDNPIGFFGTGLKYAVATVLRCGGDIEISCGEQHFRFTTKEITLRDKVFNQVVLVNHFFEKDLGFTTDLGKHWEPWMAIRELYSNCLDEKGEASQQPEFKAIDSKDSTSIIVRGDRFLDVWQNFSKYFINKEDKILSSTEYADILVADKDETSLFYKGIKIHESPIKFTYRWNIKTEIRLTEDRIVCWEWETKEAIEKAIITSNNEKIIRNILTQPRESGGWEALLPFVDKHPYAQPSAEFNKVCNELLKSMPRHRHNAALKWYENRMCSFRSFDVIKLSKLQEKQLAKSISCLDKMGFGNDLNKYEIIPVDWIAQGTMGCVKNGKIYLSKECFMLGTKYVCSTLFEELVHIHYGHRDHSRELQTWLFDQIICLAENHILGEPL